MMPTGHSCSRYALQGLGALPMTSTVSLLFSLFIKISPPDVAFYARGSPLVSINLTDSAQLADE